MLELGHRQRIEEEVSSSVAAQTKESFSECSGVHAVLTPCWDNLTARLRKWQQHKLRRSFRSSEPGEAVKAPAKSGLNLR